MSVDGMYSYRGGQTKVLLDMLKKQYYLLIL